MKSKYIRFFIAVLIGTTVFAFTGGCSGTSSKPENKLPSQQENVTLTVGKKDSVSEEEKRYGYRNGDVFLQQYRNNALVKQIILVEQAKETVSRGTLFLLEKPDCATF